MIDVLPFLKIFPVLLFALISPGPSFVMVTNMSLSKGRMAGLQCAAGMGSSDLIYATLSLLGLGILFEQIPILMVVLKILGGLYLFYVGVIVWHATLARKKASSKASKPKPDKHKNPYLKGLFTSLTNPKVIVFYGSLFTMALGHGANAATQASLPILCGLTAFGWYGFVALALSIPKILKRYEKWGKAIDRITGTVLCLFGVALMASVIA